MIGEDYIPRPVNTADSMEDIDIATDDDEKIGDKLDFRLGEVKALHDIVVKQATENMDIFQGNLDKAFPQELSKYNSKAMLNRFFLTIRNLVGYDTDNMPQVDIAPNKDTIPSIEKAQKIKTNVDWGFIRVKFLDLITQCLIDTRVKRDSFIYWFWDYPNNDFGALPVSIEELSISPEAVSIQEGEYLFYHPLKNRAWWKANYPEQYPSIKFDDVKTDEVKIHNRETSATTGKRGTVARLFMYWENQFTISAVRGEDGRFIILEKKRNPYFEFRQPEEQAIDTLKETNPEIIQMAQEGGVEPIEVMPPEQVDDFKNSFKPIQNFLSEPRKPFVQIPSLKILNSFYSVDLLKQGKETLFAYINKKRQIADNLRGCNRKIVVDSNALSEEEQEAITDEPNQVISADMQTVANPVQYVEATAPEIQFLLEDMSHDERYIDDLFGHHEISRGAGQANTLGQDQMNAESDRTPVRMQSRFVELAITEMVEGWIQLMKMFYTEKHYAKKFGAKDGVESVELINEDVEQGINPIIRPASMVKVDKAGRALQLFQLGALDPYSLYSEVGMPSPDELTNRLVNWTQFQIISEDNPEEVAADMQNQAMNGGDITQNPVERADMENKAFQAGETEIPPTPPELISNEHVKLHFDFYKDPKKKMEQSSMDLLLAHAEVDKGTLTSLITDQVANNARGQIINQKVVNKQAQGEVKAQPKRAPITN